jgi:hypothetical protein
LASFVAVRFPAERMERDRVSPQDLPADFYNDPAEEGHLSILLGERTSIELPNALSGSNA